MNRFQFNNPYAHPSMRVSRSLGFCRSNRNAMHAMCARVHYTRAFIHMAHSPMYRIINEYYVCPAWQHSICKCLVNWHVLVIWSFKRDFFGAGVLLENWINSRMARAYILSRSCVRRGRKPPVIRGYHARALSLRCVVSTSIMLSGQPHQREMTYAFAQSYIDFNNAVITLRHNEALSQH